MLDTFRALIANNKWWTFLRSLQGPVDNVPLLLNRVDIVISALHPLFARSIEALGCGKAFVSPGYNEYPDEYPWKCEYSPESMAKAILDCWSDYDRIDYRKFAETHHDVKETVKQSISIYERYL